MRSEGVLAAVFALAALACAVQGQTSYWCDGGDQQDRLFQSLNALRYNGDFKAWANYTGWAATVQTCEQVPAGSAVFANCTLVSEEEGAPSLYNCEGEGVSAGSARAAAAVYPCEPLETPGLYNCTLVETQCSTEVFSSGDHLCPCEWYGVDCESTPQRVALDLSNNDLSIMLPELFYDDIYVSIDLSKNLVYGELSGAVTNCKGLTYLDLSKNDFHGQLPELGELTGLTFLDLHKNLFAGYYPDFLVSPDDFWSDIELHFSDNMFWCPAPSWCLPPPTGNGECDTCEDLPSANGCSSESQYACDRAVGCCYGETWDDFKCSELAEEGDQLCSSPSFNWLVFFICIIAVVVIIFIGAVIAMLLTRRGQNFLIMFTRNKRNLIVVDDEEQSDTGLYDIYPDEY